MDFLDEEKEQQIREFISQYRAELILIAISLCIILISGTLFLITPTQAKTPSIPAKVPDKTSKNLQEAYIYIDIAGAVMYPDVYKLPVNTRLKSLIEKAGGYSQNAHIDQIEKTMNMSRVLTDQEKVYIPKIGDEAPLPILESHNIDPLIHINSASIDSLNDLIGVGQVTAQKIIEGRPYKQLTDLVTKKIIGKALYEKIKDQITL